jgi:hypothetical protein
METLASTGAISLRSLQTIENASNSPNNTVVFAVPVEILEGIKKLTSK